MRATTPSVSHSAPVVQASTKKRPFPAKETTQVRPVAKVIEPVVAPLVEASAASGSAVAPILEGAIPSAKKNLPENPKQTTVVLEESDGNDEIPLTSHPQPRNRPPPVSEAVVQVGPPAANHGKQPAVEPEETAETPVHPQA
ncbi:hypothetical protein ACFX10_034626 [Malus domestica]